MTRLQIKDPKNLVTKEDLLYLDHRMEGFIGDTDTEITAQMLRRSLNKAIKKWGKK